MARATVISRNSGGQTQTQILLRRRTVIIPADETPHARFVRVATRRLNTAIHAIRLLQPLASPIYDKRPQDRAKMLDALRAEINALEGAFNNPGMVAPLVVFDDE